MRLPRCHPWMCGFSICAFLFVSCAGRQSSTSELTIIVHWLDQARVDTLQVDASLTRIHPDLVHRVPAGPMAFEAYMIGSTESSTLFGWVNASARLRLPVFTGVNAVRDVLEALHELPSLPPPPLRVQLDSTDLTLFFIDGVGDPPQREVAARFWAQGGSRILRIDPDDATVHARPILRVRNNELPTAAGAHRFRIRVQGSPTVAAAVPLLVFRDGDRWVANTLLWNHVERGEIRADAATPVSHDVLLLYVFEPVAGQRRP